MTNTFPDLGNRTWCGITEAYGAYFCFEIKPSAKHPGYYHIASMCTEDSFIDETKKPVNKKSVANYVNHLLRRHGLVLNDIRWSKLPAGQNTICFQE